MKIKFWITGYLIALLLISCKDYKMPNEMNYIGYSKSDSIQYHLSRINSKQYVKQYLPASLGYDSDTIRLYYEDKSLFYGNLEFRLQSVKNYKIYNVTTNDSITILISNDHFTYNLNGHNLKKCTSFTAVFTDSNVKDAQDISYTIDLENKIVVEVAAYDQYSGKLQKLETLVDFQ